MNTKTSIGYPVLDKKGLALSICLTLVMTMVLASGTAAASKAMEYEVVVGKSSVLTVQEPIAKVSITEPAIADVVVIKPTELQIIGRSIGSTTLIIWDKAGARTFFDLNVVGDNTQLMEEINRIAPGDDVHVSVMRDMIIISGSVSSYERMFKIKKLAEEYKGGKEVKLQMVNLVEVSSVPQVLLQITVASIDREATRNLGINWAYFGTQNQIMSSVTAGLPITTINNLIQGSTLVSNSATFGNNPNFAVIDLHNGEAYMIRALAHKGLAKILAEPNLIVKSGETGTFLAGGSFPIPVVTAATAGTNAPVTVEFKDFGVKMNFSPLVKENGTIVLGMGKSEGISKIERSFGGTISSSQETSLGAAGIEVSSLDFANGVKVSGFTIPALKIDSVSTSVELKEGESFAIAGLIRDDWSKDLSKVPLLGDIPILGAFFREQAMTKTERELVFLVTPKIMKPMAPGQKAEIPGANEPTAQQEDDLRWVPLMPTARSNDPEQLK